MNQVQAVLYVYEKKKLYICKAESDFKRDQIGLLGFILY